MATIEDVARLSGLSRTTVSRVINNHPYVSESNKGKVMEAMDQLGYVPNFSARSLRNQRTGVIAVLVPRVTNPFFGRLIELMEFEAFKYSYQLIVCQTQYSPDRELNYMNLLKTRQVDGVILASIENPWTMLKGYTEYGPVVMCNDFSDEANVPTVRFNQQQGGYIATKHLIAEGHTKIGYCVGGSTSNVGRLREEGVRQALKEHGLPFYEEFAFRYAYTISDGRTVFHEIEKMDERPTALFTGADEVAAGIISEALLGGWNIPEDLAVMGFDNQEISSLIMPAITTIDQPVPLIAAKSIHLLVNKILYKEPLRKEVFEYPLELIVRDSTKLRVLSNVL